MSPPPAMHLLLFSTRPEVIEPLVAAGVAGVVIDWEWMGKRERQAGADTEINADTLADLHRVRRATRASVVTRLNCFGAHTPHEVAAAIDAGSDEVLLPMVRSLAEVEAFLNLVGGRARAGILVETAAAVRLAPRLCALPLERVYVGLNDLAIDRRSPSLFSALADGTVEAVRRCCPMAFGFGGLTLPEAGAPLPSRLLIAETARLAASFTFLRRSFRRDMLGRDPAREVPRLLRALEAARARSAAQVERDRVLLHESIRMLEAQHGLVREAAP